jgi:hypothetical protein
MYFKNLWLSLVNILVSDSIISFLINVDKVGNALTGGNYQATISGRVGWFAKQKPSKYWLILQYIIDQTFLPIEGPGHCARASKIEKHIKYRRGNDVGLFLLVFIIILTCTFILIPSIRFISIFKKGWY